MTNTLAPVTALLIGVAFLLTGNGLQGTLVAVRAEIESFSTLEIGLLGSAYFLGFAAGCVLGPHLVRRVGHIRTFSAMAAVASAVPLAHAIVLLPLPWWVMRGVTGFCFAVLFIVIESWLNERSTNETRGAILSIYLIINLTVMTVGQMMMTLSDPTGFVLFALVSILVSIAAVPVALTAAAAPAPIQSVTIRVRRLFQVSPVAFVACLAVGLANGTFWALAPVFAQRAGMDVSGIALFMSATILGGALGQWPLGRLSDRLDRRRVIVGTCGGAAAAGLTIYVLGSHFGNASVVVWLGLGGLWGSFALPLYAIAVAHANDYAAPEDFVEIASGLLLVFGAGAVIGPILASALINFNGAPAMYAFTAAVHLLLGVFALWRTRQRAPAPPSAQIAFGDALRAAQTVSEVFDAEIQQQQVEGAEGAGEASVSTDRPPLTATDT